MNNSNLNFGPYESDIIKLIPILNKNQLWLRQVEADGNCMFRAVSFGVFKTENKHLDLRKLACFYLVSNREEY
jgi:hypothetical protein